MYIHIARHGQVSTAHNGLIDGINYPYGENPLTGLGYEQAAMLGRRLRDMGFHERIFSSPYRRAMNTAACIARLTGSTVVPVPALREIVSSVKGMDKFRGLTTEEYYSDYSDVGIAGVVLPSHWWSNDVESIEDIERRVGEFIEVAIGREKDCLLVGHGGSIEGAIRYILHKYGLVCQDLGHDWNCCLSSFEIIGGTCRPQRIHDIAHIPAYQVTANHFYMVSEKS